MTQPLSKKEIAALAGITPRTMQRNWEDWKWIDQFPARGARRKRYNKEKILSECRERKII